MGFDGGRHTERERIRGGAVKREDHKIIAIGHRKFQVGKFDALTGSYVLTVVLRAIGPALSIIAPNGLDSPMDEVKEAINPALLMQLIPKFDKAELSSLQRDCLCVCQEITNLNGVDAPMAVMLPDGRWGVPGLENDAATIVILTIHTLIFNVAGFFAGNALSGLAESIKDLNLFNA